MRYWWLLCAAGLLFFGGGYWSTNIYFSRFDKKVLSLATPVASVGMMTRAGSGVENVQPAGIPEYIDISRLGLVHVLIEEVGLDAQNKMDVPKRNDDVGWYKLGAKPGEQGNAVLTGHLDTVTGAPAVFYNLASMRSGDVITITDGGGRNYRFGVVGVQRYDYDSFPLNQVFGDSDKRRLNLITCQGVYDDVYKNYSQRVVVYSELQK